MRGVGDVGFSRYVTHRGVVDALLGAEPLSFLEDALRPAVIGHRRHGMDSAPWARDS